MALCYGRARGNQYAEPRPLEGVLLPAGLTPRPGRPRTAPSQRLRGVQHGAAWASLSPSGGGGIGSAGGRAERHPQDPVPHGCWHPPCSSALAVVLPSALWCPGIWALGPPLQGQPRPETKPLARHTFQTQTPCPSPPTLLSGLTARPPATCPLTRGPDEQGRPRLRSPPPPPTPAGPEPACPASPVPPTVKARVPGPQPPEPLVLPLQPSHVQPPLSRAL